VLGEAILNTRFRGILHRLKSHELVRGSASIGLATGSNAIGQVVRNVLIATMLGVEGFGLFSLLISVTAIVHLFFDLRVNEFATRFTTLFLSDGAKAKARRW